MCLMRVCQVLRLPSSVVPTVERVPVGLIVVALTFARHSRFDRAVCMSNIARFPFTLEPIRGMIKYPVQKHSILYINLQLADLSPSQGAAERRP